MTHESLGQQQTPQTGKTRQWSVWLELYRPEALNPNFMQAQPLHQIIGGPENNSKHGSIRIERLNYYQQELTIPRYDLVNAIPVPHPSQGARWYPSDWCHLYQGIVNVTLTKAEFFLPLLHVRVSTLSSLSYLARPHGNWRGMTKMRDCKLGMRWKCLNCEYLKGCNNPGKRNLRPSPTWSACMGCNSRVLEMTHTWSVWSLISQKHSL